MSHQYSLNNAWLKHQNCEVIIYNKKFKNGLVTPGLYCKQSGTLIQWLAIQTADDLIASGVEQVLDEPVKKKRHSISRKQSVI